MNMRKERSYEERIESIKKELYTGGGGPQCQDLLKIMLGNDDISPEVVLIDIAQIVAERKRILTKDYIIPKERCDCFLEDDRPYVCLDKDLRLCVSVKGSPEWDDISHVMFYMDVGVANSLIWNYKNKEE